MKSNRQIMNETAKVSNLLHPLTEGEQKQLKEVLLLIYDDVSRLCDKYGLTYMLGYGSCLGAVRHKGYIPWDDDLDMIMPRESYMRFIELCQNGELGSQYEFTAPNKENDCCNAFLKVFRKGTLSLELMHENSPEPKGIWIDIYPIDCAPSNKVKRLIKGSISEILQIIHASVLYYQYPSEKYKEFMSQNKDAYKRYKQHIFIGRIFGVINHKKWLNWYDQINCSTKDEGFLTIPAGPHHYLGSILPTSVILPVSEGVFEGKKVYLPNNTDAYLTCLYGDYMKIPPVEERDRHFVYKFNAFNEE